MMDIHPPAILFTIAGLEIRTYGVLLGLALMIGLLWANRRARTAGVDPKLADDTLFWAAVGGLVGARLGFVIQDLGYYATHGSEIFRIWEGGLSFHGALVGGLLGGVLFLRAKKQLGQFWSLADAAAAPMLLGAAIGRLGNWANQELYGYPTDVPWAIAIDAAHRLPGYEGFASFHPTFAYEALLNILGLLLLVTLVENPNRLGRIRYWVLGIGYWVSRIRQPQYAIRNTQYAPTGTAFLLALAWYALARGITEVWRISDRVVGPLSLAQLVSIVLIIGVVIVTLHRHRSLANLDKRDENA